MAGKYYTAWKRSQIEAIRKAYVDDGLSANMVAKRLSGSPEIGGRILTRGQVSGLYHRNKNDQRWLLPPERRRIVYFSAEKEAERQKLTVPPVDQQDAIETFHACMIEMFDIGGMRLVMSAWDEGRQILADCRGREVRAEGWII